MSASNRLYTPGDYNDPTSFRRAGGEHVCAYDLAASCTCWQPYSGPCPAWVVKHGGIAVSEAMKIVRPDASEVMSALDKIVCEQTNCSDSVYDPNDCGKCAFCADVSDAVVEAYLKLKGVAPSMD